nr:hypothetical protein [Tanacetum cinerariifolium]
MRLAKKVRDTVEESESFRGKLVKTMREETSCCRTSCIYRGDEDESFSIRSSSESKMACTKREERSPYMKIEEVRMKASQCGEGCFKVIEGNAKEYQIHGMELEVIVLNLNYGNDICMQFVNHQPQEIPEVIPFIESKEWIETKNELYKMMEAYTERMNQQREQKALLTAQREQELREQGQASQREQELLAQKQAAQEKEEPPQNSDFRQLIGEMCGIKASAEKKKKLEEMMLELLELCREKEFYCVHDNIKDLIGMAMNTMLLSINLKSQRLDMEKFKNFVEHELRKPTLIEEEIRLVENFSYDNSSPRPPKELNAEIADMILEYLSPSPFPIEDSNSHMEEIDLFLATDDLMPPGIENDDYDSKRDIHFLKELLSNDPLSIPKNESSNFDHHDDPSFPRPPSKPPDVDVFFDFELDTGVLTTKVVKRISEHYVLMPNIFPTLPTLDSDLDFTPSHDSLGSENKIFDPGIFIEVQSERLLSREEFSI